MSIALEEHYNPIAMVPLVNLEPNPPREPMFVVDFPDHHRNDVFYCQKALKAHIKIHQVNLNIHVFPFQQQQPVLITH